MQLLAKSVRKLARGIQGNSTGGSLANNICSLRSQSVHAGKYYLWGVVYCMANWHCICYQGHSRHGTCLLHLKRHKEALKAFCKAHTHATSDKEKYSTADEVVSTAMEVVGRRVLNMTWVTPNLIDISVANKYRTPSLRWTVNNSDI